MTGYPRGNLRDHPPLRSHEQAMADRARADKEREIIRRNARLELRNWRPRVEDCK